MKLDDFTTQYLATALWSSTDNSREDGGDPLDQNYDISDIAASSIKAAIEDCNSFRELAGELLDGYDQGTAGHDFWLTRNRHGAGFWDGDYEKDVGNKLTELSHTFGSVDPIVGDDGQIYME